MNDALPHPGRGTEARTYLPQLDLDRQLCLPLYAASRTVTRRYTALLTEVGVTYPQYICLVALWDSPGPLSVGALGARLHLDSGTLTPLLKRLEGLGFVTRTRDSADERRVLVAVTEGGWSLRTRVADVPVRLASSMQINQTQAQVLRDLLDTIIDGVEGQA